MKSQRKLYIISTIITRILKLKVHTDTKTIYGPIK